MSTYFFGRKMVITEKDYAISCTCSLEQYHFLLSFFSFESYDYSRDPTMDVYRIANVCQCRHIRPVPIRLLIGVGAKIFRLAVFCCCCVGRTCSCPGEQNHLLPTRPGLLDERLLKQSNNFGTKTSRALAKGDNVSTRSKRSFLQW
jgi:hypothetical protein